MFTLENNSYCSLAFIVDYLISDGSDFTGVIFTLNFDEGIDELCVDIPILDDGVTEVLEEIFEVSLETTDPIVNVGPPSDAIIVDDDRKIHSL